MNLGKIGIVVSARTASSRLPGKALLPLNQMPMILFLLNSLSEIERASLLLATTNLASDDHLASIVKVAGYDVFRGNSQDLVQRYCDASRQFGFDTIVRVTGDCPFVNAQLVEWCLDYAEQSPCWDLVTTKGGFPIGLDVEIYPAKLMQKILNQGCLTSFEREHLTLHLYNNEFVVECIPTPEGWFQTNKKFTVDTMEDYQNAQKIFELLEKYNYSLKEMLSH